ncbi:MAG: hypothetical protein IMW89_03210 [Ktedonobacteraceae bacterium]|nr:hypothetical protein [Ktedonobacteraceae bacterium]
MTTASPLPEGERQASDVANWAQRVSDLELSRVPTGALNLNVEGRLAVGPLQGFGQLWQKTYRIQLPDVELTPVEVMQIWKQNFTKFLPPNTRFFPVERRVAPGEILLINDSMTGMPVSTGVVVLYADEESFTVMTPQGHPESGWNTFSTALVDGCLVCQIQSMARANDPIYELGFHLWASRVQERIWVYVLEALATHFQVQGQQVTISKVCIDPRLQWSEARNIWHNAALRTMFYTCLAPLRWLRRKFSPQ